MQSAPTAPKAPPSSELPEAELLAYPAAVYAADARAGSGVEETDPLIRRSIPSRFLPSLRIELGECKTAGGLNRKGGKAALSLAEKRPAERRLTFSVNLGGKGSSITVAKVRAVEVDDELPPLTPFGQICMLAQSVFFLVLILYFVPFP